MRFVETCSVTGDLCNWWWHQQWHSWNSFQLFWSTYNFCSGSEIPSFLIKSSVFSHLLLSTFVLFVMLALTCVLTPSLHSVLSCGSCALTSFIPPPKQILLLTCSSEIFNEGGWRSGESKIKQDHRATSVLWRPSSQQSLLCDVA